MFSDYPLFDRNALLLRTQRAAAGFAGHDFLLKHVGEDFRDRLQTIVRDFPVVVNLGSRNGALTEMLTGLNRLGRPIHVDPSAAMLQQADGSKILASEELLPLAGGSVDLVLSGLALHFVNDLPGALAQIRRCLRPDGLMLAALPGSKTLYELREAFAIAESETTGGVSPRAGPFTDVREYGALLLRTGFALPVADVYELRVTYDSPLKLMSELRAMAATNVLQDRLKLPMRRSTLFRAVEVYAEKFATEDGKVPATLEVITLTGWAPHDSQQKPLRPGSAKMRLADALGTEEYDFGNTNRRKG